MRKQRRAVRVYNVPGEQGPQPAYEWKGTSIRFTEPSGKWGDWVDLQGLKGASAFEVAQAFGFKGDEKQWLDSLKIKGEDGKDGLSAYQIAVEKGFTGNNRDWLNSLKAADGKDGLSAYEIAKKRGFRGTELQWLESLKGADGLDGLSAYEVWLALGNKGTEEDFFEWLARKVQSLIKPFQNTQGAGSIRLKLGMLSDVDTSGAINGKYLGYVDGEWIPVSGDGSGIVVSVVAGTGISVDSTDPANPVVSSQFASVSEVDTGTEAAKSVTPDALAGSYAGTKSVNIVCFAPTSDVTVGDGAAYITIPESCNGMDLIRATATVVTAGTTGASTMQIRNVTQAADMLSGVISIASGGTVATAGTIDTANDDVVTNDVIAVDVDSVSTTAPKGLIIILEFRLS